MLAGPRLPIKSLPVLTGDAIVEQFGAALTEYGLTDDEAAGLMDVWRPQLFETDGRRLLVILAADDYDRMCPVRVGRAPTELVRLGILLTEF